MISRGGAESQKILNHETHELHKREEEGHAGAPSARAGRAFVTASASKLATTISNTLLHSLRE
jgi:hypothetical protein